MKNLKVAEIVPVSCLEETSANQYHMCLAHLVSGSDIRSTLYRSFFKCRVKEGKYVLMDNGAAENSQLDFDGLLEAYELVHPTEIILPDVLCDGKATIERTCGFYDRFSNHISDYNLMVVPQGNNFDEWCECARELLYEIPATTVGVSKFLEMITNDNTIRVKACEFLKQYDVEIHLLGCSEGPKIIKEARVVNDKVRGCDSAFTYICAKAGLESINIDTTRPEGEIDFLNDPVITTLNRMMRDFEFSAGVKYNICDDTWK